MRLKQKEFSIIISFYFYSYRMSIIFTSLQHAMRGRRQPVDLESNTYSWFKRRSFGEVCRIVSQYFTTCSQLQQYCVFNSILHHLHTKSFLLEGYIKQIIVRIDFLQGNIQKSKPGKIWALRTDLQWVCDVQIWWLLEEKTWKMKKAGRMKT